MDDTLQPDPDIIRRLNGGNCLRTKLGRNESVTFQNDVNQPSYNDITSIPATFSFTPPPSPTLLPLPHIRLLLSSLSNLCSYSGPQELSQFLLDGNQLGRVLRSQVKLKRRGHNDGGRRDIGAGEAVQCSSRKGGAQGVGIKCLAGYCRIAMFLWRRRPNLIKIKMTFSVKEGFRRKNSLVTFDLHH